MNVSQIQLTGTIPSILGSFKSLTGLVSTTNALSGTIPSVVMALPLLQKMNFSSNQFTGQIPSNIGQATSLLQLSLANNRLTGSIPSTINQASNLQRMNLSNNLLSGELPKTFATMSLSSVNLKSNYLSMGTGILELNPFTFSSGTLNTVFSIVLQDNCIKFDYTGQLSVIPVVAHCSSPTEPPKPASVMR